MGRLELYFHAKREGPCHRVFCLSTLIVPTSPYFRVEGVEAGDRNGVQGIHIEPDAVYILMEHAQSFCVKGVP